MLYRTRNRDTTPDLMDLLTMAQSGHIFEDEVNEPEYDPPMPFEDEDDEVSL